MNCRPRDTCYVVNMHPALGINGRVVTLTNEPPVIFEGIAVWHFEAPIVFITPETIHDLRGNTRPAGAVIELATLSDGFLRPIRDPGDDAVDEIVRKVGVAPKTLTEIREVSDA